MVRTITPLSSIKTLEISFSKKPPLMTSTPSRANIVAEGMDELILRSGPAAAYGFKEQKSGYTLPLLISDDFAEALDVIDIKLGDLAYSPVYLTSDGARIYVRVIMSKGGIVFSNIYDKAGKTVRPDAKTDDVMNVKAAIVVDSVFFGGKPKIQLSLIEAMLQDTEMVREKLL